MSRQHRRPKFEGDIRVVELTAYTPPKIIEDPRKDFGRYGEDNYYQYLIYRIQWVHLQIMPVLMV